MGFRNIQEKLEKIKSFKLFHCQIMLSPWFYGCIRAPLCFHELLDIFRKQVLNYLVHQTLNFQNRYWFDMEFNFIF